MGALAEGTDRRLHGSDVITRPVITRHICNYRACEDGTHYMTLTGKPLIWLWCCRLHRAIAMSRGGARQPCHGTIAGPIRPTPTPRGRPGRSSACPSTP